MSRLRSGQAGSKVQPEVVGLVHDEVVSLCHRMYSATSSGVEIDGIICISLLDTNEQQVVKIHKTLKSVVADVGRKSKAGKNSSYPKIASILSAGSPATPRDHAGQEKQAGDVQNFQNDISTLSDILKASGAIIRAEAEAALHKTTDTLDSKKSKRKRKKPKHRADMMYDAENEDSQENQNLNKKNSKARSTEMNEESNRANVERVTVTVKEEPQDTGYEEIKADTGGPSATCENPLDYSTMPYSSKDSERESSNNAGSQCDIDKQENSENRERSPPPVDHRVNDDGSVEVRIKAENTDQDGDYGMVTEQSIRADTESGENLRNDIGDTNCDSDDNHEIPDDTEDPGEDATEWNPESEYESLSRTLRKSQEAEKHWLYGISKKQGGGGEESAGEDSGATDATQLAMMDKYQQRGSHAHQGYQREVRRQDRDPLGRSWIQMVKDNVTKYQSAMMRSITKKPEEEGPSAPPGSAAGLLRSLAAPKSLLNTDHLKALLREPPLQLDRSPVTDPGLGTGTSSPRHGRDKSLTLNTNSSCSDRSRSASASPAPTPIVKIEVDDDPQHYSQLETTASGTTALEIPLQEGERLPVSGKLESRYPALFNQLQQAKKDGQPVSQDTPADSLVNRLPFISFQELFATASPAPAAPGKVDMTTQQLLERARISPNQRVIPPRKKSVWKWKKRQVKPKPNQVEVEAEPLETASEDTPESTKPLGIHMSAKKTFGKKRPKEEDSSDTDWTPGAIPGEEETQGASSDGLEPVAKKKIKTRLSTGEKPRMNFAELENSDIEFEDDVKEEPEEPIELVSAYCRNNCGMRCVSFTELTLHEQTCNWSQAEVGGASAVGGAVGVTGETTVGLEGPATSGDTDYKCTICGLDFNQEYRWQYHMVKVHGVAADETVLFR